MPRRDENASAKRTNRLASTTLALGALAVVGAARPLGPPVAAVPGFVVRALTVLPGETVTLELGDRTPAAGYVARPAAGRLEPLSTGRWAWTAPPTPGHYPIRVVAPAGGDSVTLQAFVVVPYDRLQGELLNGYRIGRYPRTPPAGFVEVTRENEDVLVAPHFRLKQFLCKQPGGSRKYVVLNERLLHALEYVLAQVNASGYRATTLHVMSGYRTPAYNRSIGNVRYSQHQWGAAADIFIDENGDGVMDDLNGNGRSDSGDADVLYRLIDRAAARPEGLGLIGGLGQYPATRAHGPFVHLDVRDRKARW